ncbi:MAG: tetratricopeptide repeat protein [Deltaproteobacteria bacterium]|nr:tetratricopeptide repeat protein [Deltaproteobacteria bacterium]
MNNPNISFGYRSIITIISFIIVGQISYADGTTPSSGKSASEKREEANIYFKRGLNFQNSENYIEASKEYKKAVRADSKYAEAWSNLGYSYRKQGNYKKAIKAYKKAIKIDPKLAEAHEYLGEAYAEIGKFDLAVEELQILKSLGSEEAEELEAFIEKKKKGA